MKLTKKSFNRRIYAFGLMMFVAIGLISTGFASWVMSKNAAADTEGDITVGTITDGSIQITDLAIAGEFRFEPHKDDKTGFVQYNAPVVTDENPNPKETHENLTVTLTGKVKPATYFNKISFEIKENDLPVGVKAAIDAKYITAPTCYKNAVTFAKADDATVDEITVDTANDEVTFTYTISFGWGEKFGFENPSLYLEAENGYTYDTAFDELVAFRRTMFQLPEVPTGEEDTNATYTKEEVMKYTPNPDQALKYKVTVTAEAIV